MGDNHDDLTIPAFLRRHTGDPPWEPVNLKPTAPEPPTRPWGIPKGIDEEGLQLIREREAKEEASKKARLTALHAREKAEGKR
jgi:hypothetical protein